MDISPSFQSSWEQEKVTGVILCGGKSRRFGSDKAFAFYQGERFFDRIFQVMSRLFRHIAVVTHTPDKYRGVAASILEDEVPDQGPIGGIITALRFARTRGSEAVFVVACDMPLLREAEIRRLFQADNGSDLLAYGQTSRLEPLCALYRTSLLPLLESRCRAGIRDLQSLLTAGIRIRRVPLREEERDSLQNINTRLDLRRLENR